MQTRTRREMLRLLPGAAVALGVPGFVTGCRDGSPPRPTEVAATPTAGPTATATAAEPVPLPSSPPAESSLVAVSLGADLRQLARDAVNAIGGMQSVVRPGDRVFIKPNFVTASSAGSRPIFRNGECAKPEIVVAVTEECLKAGASEVIIGDGAQVRRFSWELMTTMDGTTNLALEAVRLMSAYTGKVTLACLNTDSPEWVDIPTRTRLGAISVSSLVAGADRVISIPVIKTHTNAALSLSLKNMVGVISSEHHGGYPYRTDIHLAGLEQSFVDVVGGVKPDLAIIDGSICCEANGPSVDAQGGRGRTVDMRDRLGSWLLLASTDLLAADATAARIIGHDPANIRQFPLAFDQGIGRLGEDDIRLVGARLSDLLVPWQPAQIAGGVR